jgi:hypothetical protein
VGNISRRNAAMYCNWLHNDKSTDRSAFLDGAYDVSTFTYTPFGAFNDQITRHTTARYWIPSWDEWLKAAHHDPNRHGPGQEGWWFWSNSRVNNFIVTSLRLEWNAATKPKTTTVPGPGTMVAILKPCWNPEKLGKLPARVNTLSSPEPTPQ